MTAGVLGSNAAMIHRVRGRLAGLFMVEQSFCEAGNVELGRMADSKLKQTCSRRIHPPGSRAEIRALYADLQLKIDQRQPLCVMSGRCCHFDEYGHRSMSPQPNSEPSPPNWQITSPSYLSRPSPAAAPFKPAKSAGPYDPPHGMPDILLRYHRRRVATVDLRAISCPPEEAHEVLSIPYSYVEWAFACRELGWQS